MSRFARWAAGLAGTVLLVVGCMGTEGGQNPNPPPVAGEPDGGSGATLEPPDAGSGPPDAGPPPVLVPPVEGWEFYGRAEGGPSRVLGASFDEGGNLWVAGADEGLFFLAAGAGSFRRFTAADGLAHYADVGGLHGYAVLSVAGGKPGEAFVGYQALPTADVETSPLWERKSGDADRVVYRNGTLSVSHFDISTPPSSISEDEDGKYPNGREKVSSVLRIVHNPATGDVWFGGNHGVAMYDARANAVYEHRHAAINGYTATSYTLLSGDWYGLTLDPAGDVWFGGGHRVTKVEFSASRNFYAPMIPSAKTGPGHIDVWPDAVTSNARPEQRTDDYVQDLAAVNGSTVWVGSIPNGLARVHLNPDHTYTVARIGRGIMVDEKVTSLELDPSDGSLWVGHIYGGITRFKDGQVLHYDYRVLGKELIRGRVVDLQSDRRAGGRRVVASFDNGVVGVFRGP